MPSSPRSATTSVAPNSTPEVGAVRVPAHEDDLLRAQPLGRQHGGQPDRAVADHGDGGPRADPGGDRGVVAGAGTRRTGSAAMAAAPSPPRPGSLTRVPCGLRDPDRLGLAAADLVVAQKPPCRHEVCRPSRQKSQVLSDHTNGATAPGRPASRPDTSDADLLDDAEELVADRAPCSAARACPGRGAGRCRRCRPARPARRRRSDGQLRVRDVSRPGRRRRRRSVLPCMMFTSF